VVTPAAPKLTRHGRVRVRRSGRTFVVRTRDWVQCADGCVVSVSGSRVRSAQRTVAAGTTARVAVKLNRRGARALRRRGRVRLTIALTARVAGGAPVSAQRNLRVRLPTSGTS
jgi:hypothetical protein